MKQPTFTDLVQVSAAIAAEKAQPAIYRSGVVAVVDETTATIARLETLHDVSNIPAVIETYTRRAAALAALEELDKYPPENWGRMRADKLCKTHADAIVRLLESELAMAEKRAPGLFEKLAEKLAATARRAISRTPNTDDVRLAAIEEDRLRGEAHDLNYALEVAKGGIGNFLAAPSEESFNTVAAAIRTAQNFA